jgi:ubiquinone/menaquinone biosynthesis C-methylase UbiE
MGVLRERTVLSMSFSRSRIAAKLQEMVSKRREESGLYNEIADLLPLMESGRLLDIGTGTGLQLRVIREMKPNLDLFGLDVSDHAIQIAEKYLAHKNVDLRVGSIEKTDYHSGFFDIVACSSSMSYWKSLESCFNEIYRILKSGGLAQLIEPRKDIDIDEAVEIIRRNLGGESRFRVFLATNLNKFGLRWGGKIGLKLYEKGEVERIARQSRFGNQVKIKAVILQNLPIFMQINLEKISKQS